MPKLGVHVSVSGGVDKAFDQAVETGCETIQIFTKSNNRWQAKELAPAEIERYHRRQAETGIGPVVTHTSYLINLGTPDDELWEKSIAALIVEAERCELLKIPWLVLHPGAHVGSGVSAGLARVSLALDQVHAALPEHQVKITLEITAGQGTTLGRTFEELAAIISACRQPERLAVCFDTCHALSAGYDFRTQAGYAAMWARFDETIGLNKLAVFHLNDTKNNFESHKDRHTHIGEGFIGLEPFGFFLNDPRFAALPFLLETPQDTPIEDDKKNLAKLRGLIS